MSNIKTKDIMDKKEQWAEEVMQSLKGIERAKPSSDLFAKISSHLPDTEVVNIVPARRMAWVAAAACLIIGLNVYVFTNEIKTSSKAISQVDDTQLLNNYTLYN